MNAGRAVSARRPTPHGWETNIKPIWRFAIALLSIVLLAGGTICIVFSWKRLQGTDDAEIAGWFVMLGLGLSGAAAFLTESVIFPRPKVAAPRLRFVILHHEGIEEPHFDLMLETSPGSMLATWRSPVWPITTPTMLTQLPDHRVDYLTYEGEVSGGRGRVRQIGSGTYTISNQPDGGKRIEWDDAAAPPLNLRRVDEKRWSAIPK